MRLTEYIREIDVLAEWPMSKATLIMARKKGLKFVRLGAFICYKPEDLEAHFCAPRSWTAATPDGKGGAKMENENLLDFVCDECARPLRLYGENFIETYTEGKANLIWCLCDFHADEMEVAR